MKHYERNKRKRIGKKNIKNMVYLIIAKYTNTKPSKKQVNKFIKFLQIENSYNNLGYRLYNLFKEITKYCKEYEELRECLKD